MDLFPQRAAKGRKPRRGFFRRNLRRVGYVASGPIATIGLKEIGKGRTLIECLLGIVRAGPIGDFRLKSNPDGSLDLVATAFDYGIGVPALQNRLRQRRLQTCRAAYVMFGLGFASLALWLYAALQVPLMSGRMLAAIEFIPCCLLFFLLSFKSAWMNWQLRTLRLGSAAEFMRTTEPFLPRAG